MKWRLYASELPLTHWARKKSPSPRAWLKAPPRLPPGTGRVVRLSHSLAGTPVTAGEASPHTDEPPPEGVCGEPGNRRPFPMQARPPAIPPQVYAHGRPH